MGADGVCVCPQVEKTRHYLLLREKLESTLLLGQDSLLGICEEAGPQPSDPGLDPGDDLHSERQRELATKVRGRTLTI